MELDVRMQGNVIGGRSIELWTAIAVLSAVHGTKYDHLMDHDINEGTIISQLWSTKDTRNNSTIP